MITIVILKRRAEIQPIAKGPIFWRLDKDLFLMGSKIIANFIRGKARSTIPELTIGSTTATMDDLQVMLACQTGI